MKRDIESVNREGVIGESINVENQYLYPAPEIVVIPNVNYFVPYTDCKTPIHPNPNPNHNQNQNYQNIVPPQIIRQYGENPIKSLQSIRQPSFVSM